MDLGILDSNETFIETFKLHPELHVSYLYQIPLYSSYTISINTF